MLEAFDLTGSLRDAGELAGCSHHTVAAYVARRGEGRLPGVGPVRRKRIIDPRRSRSGWSAPVARSSLLCQAEGGTARCAEQCGGQEELRGGSAAGVIPEPGMWAQWDWGTGPVIAGRRANSDLGPHPAHGDRLCGGRCEPLAALRRAHRQRAHGLSRLGSLCAIRRWSRSAAIARWRRVCRRTARRCGSLK